MIPEFLRSDFLSGHFMSELMATIRNWHKRNLSASKKIYCGFWLASSNGDKPYVQIRISDKDSDQKMQITFTPEEAFELREQLNRHLEKF